MSSKSRAKSSAAADAKAGGDDRSDRPYDLIVWGSTSFTGTLCVQYIARKQFEAKTSNADNEWSRLKWAIGGRSASKLNAMKTGVEKELREELKDQTVTVTAEVVLADSGDSKSLEAMVTQTRVIISSVGPFRQYGSALVAACVKHRTDYVDTTGEHLWVKQQIDAHHQTCVENGTVIVPMCGYDSIPSDIGTFLLSRHLKQTYGDSAVLDSVRHVAKAGGGAGASGGTLHTMLDIMEQVSNDRSGFGKDLANPYVLIPKPDQPTKSPKAGSENEYPLPLKVVDGAGPGTSVWTAPFVMSVANSAVVRRSAYLLNNRENKQKESYGPDFAYFGERMNVKTLIASVIFLVVLGFVALLAQLSFIRNFARKVRITSLPPPLTSLRPPSSA